MDKLGRILTLKHRSATRCELYADRANIPDLKLATIVAVCMGRGKMGWRSYPCSSPLRKGRKLWPTAEAAARRFGRIDVTEWH